TLFANVRGHALQRHHRARAGFFGDFGLLGVGDVHNHAALEHLREADFHAPLIRPFASVAASIWFLRVHCTSPLDPKMFSDFLQTNATRLRSALLTPRCRLRISIFSNSASVATPRAICFSSRLAKPNRSVFGNGACT